VVNTEGVTSKKIKKALKNFCQIPQGDLFLNQNETEGVRVALINYFISNDQSVVSGVVEDIEYIVYVDPKAYARLQTHEEKTAVGRAVGRLNRRLDKNATPCSAPAAGEAMI